MKLGKLFLFAFFIFLFLQVPCDIAAAQNSCVFSNIQFSRSKSGTVITASPSNSDTCTAVPSTISLDVFNLYNQSVTTSFSSVDVNYISGPATIVVGTASMSVGGRITRAFIHDNKQIRFNMAGDYRFQAVSNQGPAAAPQTITVSIQSPPSAQVASTDLCLDQIATTVQPALISGMFTLQLTGLRSSVVLVQQNRRGGSYIDSFNMNTLPNGDFSSVDLIWTVNGKTVRASHPLRFRVLGNYRITCYDTVVESDYGGSSVRAGTEDRCNWSPRQFRAAFLDDVNLNGSGDDISLTAMQIGADNVCRNAPAADPQYCGPAGPFKTCQRYIRPADIRTSCSDRPQPNFTVAINRKKNFDLTCEDDVVVQGIGCRRVQDNGGGLTSTQIDNFGGIGRPSCANWSNKDRKIIKLLK